MKYSILSGICTLLLCAGCTTFFNQATGRSEYLLIDTPYEVSLGKDMTAQIAKEYTVSGDARLQRRLEAIGNRVAAVSDRKDLNYHFVVIQADELNAFAIPGGYVYVNSGLINKASDDELACVVAHEVGHIAARHSVKRLQTVLGYQLVLSLALGKNTTPSVMQDAMNVIFSLITLGYSRQDELLSDDLSVRYSRRAGYNPSAMITFFEKLKKETSAKGSHYNPVFLSSHPSLDERIANIRAEIALP